MENAGEEVSAEVGGGSAIFKSVLFVSLPLKIKRWGLFILIGFTLSTSSQLSKGVTPFITNKIPKMHGEKGVDAIRR